MRFLSLFPQILSLSCKGKSLDGSNFDLNHHSFVSAVKNQNLPTIDLYVRDGLFENSSKVFSFFAFRILSASSRLIGLRVVAGALLVRCKTDLCLL